MKFVVTDPKLAANPAVQEWLEKVNAALPSLEDEALLSADARIHGVMITEFKDGRIRRVDPNLAPGEIRCYQDGKLVGQIVNAI